MWSKYHPCWEKLKESKIEILSKRFEGAVWTFAFGLLAGFCFGSSLFFGIVFLMGMLLFYFVRQKPFLSWVVLMLSFFCLGLSWAQLRLNIVKHPTLSHPLFQIEISGEIQDNLVLPEKQIITLSKIKWPRSDLNNPDKIQFILNEKDLDLKLKDQITGKVSVFPILTHNLTLKSPKFPMIYFQGIGARGQMLEIKKVISANKKPTIFEQIRQKIIHRAFQILPENQARIAIPLITGEQKFVSSDQYKIYRQAGITHVLSVSGFHMALLAGFLFFIIRGFCAFIPYLTLHFNAKKIAAILAWLGTLFYLILSGCRVPALRSFGMISLVFLGILVDRLAFSQRSLFLVGFLLLFVCPENILSVSFQLSFLSVLILITVHEAFQKRNLILGKTGRCFCEFLTLNLAITLGLMPLIAWHFHLINPYGLIGNLILSIVFSLGIMPCLFLACLMMPFHFESGFFMLAGKLIYFVEWVSKEIGQWPYCEISFFSFPSYALVAFVLSILFMCLYKTWGKIGAFFLILIGFTQMIGTPQADLFACGNTFQWQDQGKVYQNKMGQSWLLNRWQNERGFQKVKAVELPEVIRIKDKKIALTSDACVGADMALLSVPDSRCSIPTLVRDKTQLYQVFVFSNEILVKGNKGTLLRIKS